MRRLIMDLVLIVISKLSIALLLAGIQHQQAVLSLKLLVVLRSFICH
jgi:hypothetical protein